MYIETRDKITVIVYLITLIFVFYIGYSYGILEKPNKKENCEPILKQQILVYKFNKGDNIIEDSEIYWEGGFMPSLSSNGESDVIDCIYSTNVKKYMCSLLKRIKAEDGSINSYIKWLYNANNQVLNY